MGRSYGWCYVVRFIYYLDVVVMPWLQTWSFMNLFNVICSWFKYLNPFTHGLLGWDILSLMILLYVFNLENDVDMKMIFRSLIRLFVFLNIILTFVKQVHVSSVFFFYVNWSIYCGMSLFNTDNIWYNYNLENDLDIKMMFISLVCCNIFLPSF